MGSEILKTLSGGSICNIDNEKDLRSKKPSTYTATLSGIKNVHSIFPGTVLFLGYYEGTGTLYVSISKHEMVRYMNLKTLEVWKGQEVSKGDLLGTTYNVPLQFEYCTAYQQESLYPVRFMDRTYYKQNPIDLLDGKYWPYEEITVRSGIVRTNTSYTFTEEQKREWFSSEYQVDDDYGDSTTYYFPVLKSRGN